MFKKAVLACATAALLAFGATALAGCGGQSAEDLIRNNLSAEFDQVKNLDEEFLNEVTADASTSGLEEFGIDAVELMKAYFGGFDYVIDDVTVDGDTATATVTLTCKSFDDYMNAVTDVAMSASSDTDLGAATIEAVNAIEPVQIDPIEIPYEKVDNTWEPTAEGEQALYSALFEG